MCGRYHGSASSASLAGSGSSLASGLSRNDGSGGFLGSWLVRVNAVVSLRKSMRAVTPFFVPRMKGSHIVYTVHTSVYFLLRNSHFLLLAKRCLKHSV